MPVPITRRTLLRGLGRTPVFLALPALEAMFGRHGNAWADSGKPVGNRFVFWFNGNGVPEKFFMPNDAGQDFTLSPCLSPLAPVRRHVHVLTGLDNAPGVKGGAGNGHTNSMSPLVSGMPYTGRGAGGPSIDQAIAGKIGNDTRFRSLQIGVAQESFGDSMHRNLSWAGANRPLPPEMIPQRLFDRLFGQRELGWVARQKSVLDAVRADAAELQGSLGATDRARLDEHLASIRDLERAITTLPPRYSTVMAPEHDGDLRDWPRIAKLQTDLLVHALASRQTRVASYMLTKCQGLTRFPWLGHTVLRHHDYTHTVKVPGTDQLADRAFRDIVRWHVEELAYLISKLASVPEGNGTLLDRTLVLSVNEHAEGNDHKNTGHCIVLAGRAGKLRTGLHSRVAGSIGDLYLTVANRALGARLTGFPTASRTLDELFET